MKFVCLTDLSADIKHMIADLLAALQDFRPAWRDPGCVIVGYVLKASDFDIPH